MMKARKNILILLFAAMLAVLCVLSLSSVGEWQVTESGSAVEGVTVHLKEAQFDTDKPYITVELRNETAAAFSYGGDLSVVRLTDGRWESCATEPIFYTSVGHTLFDEETETYYLRGFDLRSPGRYRFFFCGSKLWIEFEKTS